MILIYKKPNILIHNKKIFIYIITLSYKRLEALKYRKVNIKTNI